MLHERRSVVGLLIDGLVEEDDTADVRVHLLSTAEQHLTVLPSVLLVVLHLDHVETLAHRRVALVGRQNALARSNERLGDTTQLIFAILR